VCWRKKQTVADAQAQLDALPESPTNLVAATSLEPETVGYHIAKIPKGTIGQLSKIREELLEAEDAEQQGCKLMVLLELSDMVGAIEAYLEAQHPGMTLQDLQQMAAITQRAFRSGLRRSNKQGANNEQA
jgi:hypothetical protein